MVGTETKPQGERMATPPGTFIREELDKRGWSQTDFAGIIGRPIQVVNEIILGKRAITPDTAAEIGAALGTGAEVWLQREVEYRLTQTEVDTSAIQRRAWLYELAPVKELERRQWIGKWSNTDELESQLKKFFGVDSLEAIPEIGAVARKTDHSDPMDATQRAWCFRVRQIARSFLVSRYDENQLPKLAQELRKLAAYPQEASKISQMLSSYGIRCVIVEPLAGCKVDGVAMWLDHDSPVIGLSLRYDRMDAFWFTMFHELSHIRHRDESPPADADVSAQMMLPTEMKDPIERRADEEAADTLIPKDEINSFILRVGPLYSKEKIIRFAHRVKIHPGIVVGQLQHRGEIGYHANREMLKKIRDVIKPSAITDGWGNSIDLGALS